MPVAVSIVGMSKQNILGISLDQPERLFGNPQDVTPLYRQAARTWHPDVAETGDAEVFAHINSLHSAALKKIAQELWHFPGVLRLLGVDGVERHIRYVKEFDCGLGRGYISKSFVTYVIANEYADLMTSAQKTVDALCYPNDTERQQVIPCLPKLKVVFETQTSVIWVVEKPTDTVRLRDLLDHLRGKIDPKHVGWIINRLLMLMTFLQYNRLAHGDVSLDTVFISPERHSAALIGGWWYSVALGSKMARVQPVRTLACAPPSVLTAKLGSSKVDLELVRLIGREILGDATGVGLLTDKTIPPAMVEWLRSATAGDAITDYTRWPEVLQTSYGARRFVPLPISFSDIYKESM